MEEIKLKVYPDRFSHIYLFESEKFEPGDILLVTVSETDLDHDAIVCSPGGSADVKRRMPFTNFITIEEA